MPVNPQLQQILDTIASRNAPPIYTLTPAEAREASMKVRKIFVGESPALARIENRAIPGPAGEIPVRLFADAVGKALPLLVYYHGGGWVVGNLDTHDDVCRRLALHSGCLVMSVDYRLAPEHKFPAAVDDAMAAVRWAARHGAEIGGDPRRIAVGGDSAGGNLAAVVSLIARDEGNSPIRFQLLVYPATAHDFSAPSMKANAKGYFLEVEGMRWFLNHYFRSWADASDPLAAPIRAASLAGLPPAYVITAAYDPLCDEGELYARKLKEAGVPTEHRRYEDAIHAFFTMSVTELTSQTVKDAAAALKRALGS
jgi:acetyl esterase